MCVCARTCTCFSCGEGDDDDGGGGGGGFAVGGLSLRVGVQ